MTQIFISYAREDFKTVNELRQRLKDEGFTPWMDRVDLLAGQRWRPAIEQAMRESDFFVLCLSNHTVSKRGFVQHEIKMAHDLWQKMLTDDIFLIPVLLEHIEQKDIPTELLQIGWVFLYEENGWDDLLRSLNHGKKQRDLEIRLEHQRKEAVEKAQREETARRQQEEAVQLKKEREAAEARRQVETAQKQKAEARRREDEARELAEAEQHRKQEGSRPRPNPEPVSPASNNRSLRLPVLAGAILLVCFLGYWIWNSFQSPAIAPSIEDLLQPAQQDESNGNFRVRFTPQRDGYLYLVALDEAGIPITLLTNRHAYQDGGCHNRLTAGRELVFPPGVPLTLIGNKSSAPLTVIFSPVELKDPAFLDAAELSVLTEAEWGWLKKMKRQVQSRTSKTSSSAGGEAMTALPSNSETLVSEIVLLKQPGGN